MAPTTRSSLKNIENKKLTHTTPSKNNKATKKTVAKKYPSSNKKAKLVKTSDDIFDDEIEDQNDDKNDSDFDPKDISEDEIFDDDNVDDDEESPVITDSDNDFDDVKKNSKTSKTNKSAVKTNKKESNPTKRRKIVKKEKSKSDKSVKDEKITENHSVNDDNDSNDDDWEEVEDIGTYKNENDEFNPDDYNPEIPDQLKISFGNQNGGKNKQDKKSKHWKWVRQCVRIDMNKMRKRDQINAHKAHLLLSIYRLQYLNKIINDDLLKALIMSTDFYTKQMVKKSPKSLSSLLNDLENFIENFREHFSVIIKKDSKKSTDKTSLSKELIKAFETKKISCQLIYNIIIIKILRTLNFNVRLCYVLCPVPIKALNLLSAKTKFQKNKSEPLLGAEKPKIQESSCYWIEIFDSKNKKWKSIDIHNEIYGNDDNDSSTSVMKIASIRKKQISFISYVFAIDNNGYISDVTQRYCQQWFSRNRLKNRIDSTLVADDDDDDDDDCDNDSDWLRKTLKPFKYPIDSVESKADQNEFDKQLKNIEFPKHRSSYKDHPVFVLEKDLLQYQALYPPNPPTLGFINDEPIYSRDCVHLLKSRERWLNNARVVKLNETPYKIIKSRFKRKRRSSSSSSSIMIDFNKKNGDGNNEPDRDELELFGRWQTEPYEPPVATNGLVPRNAYGNVDLFKKCMLPKGTKLIESKPFIEKLAYRLNIDCAPAIVGFGYKKHPTRITFGPKIGGYVVCEEFYDKLMKEYENFRKEQENREKLAKEKKIYGNWRRLIRSVIIRHNLRIKYGS